MRIDGSVEKAPVLVAIGVTKDNRRTVLGLQVGDKESASNWWRELSKDLKRRGLIGSAEVLGVMDGLPGLERIFREEFPKARIQRCQMHVARNVLAKVPRKVKKAIGDETRSIFAPHRRRTCWDSSSSFKDTWEKEPPSTVTCLERLPEDGSNLEDKIHRESAQQPAIP